MSKVKDDTKFPIKITNFINPHLFYFKLENIIGQLDTEIEHQLKQNSEKVKWEYPSGYNAKQHEMVAAYVVEWGKWVRAQVDLILEQTNNNQYLIWCLDHG